MGRTGAAIAGVTVIAVTTLLEFNRPATPAPVAPRVVLPARYSGYSTEQLHQLHRELDTAVTRVEQELENRRTELTGESLYAKYSVGVVEIIAHSEGRVLSGTGFRVDAFRENTDHRLDLGFATNYHVIAGATRVQIRASGGQVSTIRWVTYADERNDLAIVAPDIPFTEQPHLPLSRSLDLLPSQKNPIIGSPVYVIGNPKGLQNSISQGIVSAIRDVGVMNMRFQITAPVSPGSSGSPVFNKYGEVIGVVSSSIVDGQNLNFAIPSDYLTTQSATVQPISIADWAKRTAKKE